MGRYRNRSFTVGYLFLFRPRVLQLWQQVHAYHCLLYTSEYLTLSLGRLLYIANSEYSSFTVWTTRVSNPVWYPHFRASVSVAVQWAAFAIGVLRDIEAFHRYTTNSAHLYCTQDSQYQLQFYGWAANFHNWLNCPPTLPLNPINPDNARILRITAAAGTELADPYS